MTTRHSSGYCKDRALLGLIFLAVISYVYIASTKLHMNHDVGYFLWTAQRVLSGERLYIDIIQSNTPWIVYLSMIPVGLGTLFSIPVTSAMYIFVVMLGLASLTLCWRIMCNHWFRHKTQERILLTFLAVIMFISPSFIVFGQREHLFFLLILPYVFGAISYLKHQPVSKRLRMIIGLFATAGILIKPHFTLTFIASELCLMLLTRQWFSWLRADSMTVIISGIIYYLGIILFQPEMFDNMPLLLAMYPGYELSMADFITISWTDMFSLVIIGLLLCQWSKRPYVVPLTYLTAIALACYIQFIAHKAGFYYQRLPYDLLMYLLVIMALLSFEKIRALSPLLMTLCFLPLLYFSLQGPLERLANGNTMDAFRKISQKYQGASATSLSTSMFPAFPAINYMEGTIHSPLSIIFYVPAMYMDQRNSNTEARYHRPSAMPPVEKQFFNATIEDIVRNQPDILFVPDKHMNQGLDGVTFDMITYFSQDPRFARAIAAYAPTGDVLYDTEIWKRKTQR